MGWRKASHSIKPRFANFSIWNTDVTHYLIGLMQPPHSWAVIPPDQTISRHVEVLVSADSTVYSVDNLETTDQRLSRGPFSHLAPSPNGKSLALLTYTGTLWVVSADFQRSLAEYETSNVIGATGGVKQVEWCGNDAVLLTWDTTVVLVGPFGDTLQYVTRVDLPSRSFSHPAQVFLFRTNFRCYRVRWYSCYWSGHLRLPSEGAQ